jgi:putative solute:sodium symporter small subunit
MSEPDPTPGGATDHGSAPDRHAYWRINLRYVATLLTIWFAVSYGAGILFVEQFNAITLPGTSFPLGFWFAQQGSIYVFVALIFVYVVLMNRLDRRFGVDEEDETAAQGGGGTPASGGGTPAPGPEASA